jgi:hypothetical protein
LRCSFKAHGCATPKLWFDIHVNMTTCLSPNFITVVVAMLHLESQHASNLKKGKYLDVHLNWLILHVVEWVHGGL